MPAARYSKRQESHCPLHDLSQSQTEPPDNLHQSAALPAPHSGSVASVLPDQTPHPGKSQSSDVLMKAKIDYRYMIFHLRSPATAAITMAAADLVRYA